MGDRMSELVSHIDYGKFFDELLQLDKNVRLAAIMMDSFMQSSEMEFRDI